MSEELDGIFPARISAHVLENMPEEIDHAERGEIFVAWPRPPRVGARVHLALAFGDGEPERHDAFVVWSRPPRPGVVGGFRARLTSSDEALREKLRAIGETARQRVVMRDVGRRPEAPRPAPRPANSTLLDAPIRERIRRPLQAEELEPTSTLLRPRPQQPYAPPAAPTWQAPVEEPASDDLDLPPVEAFQLELGSSTYGAGAYDDRSPSEGNRNDELATAFDLQPEPSSPHAVTLPEPEPAPDDDDDPYADLGPTPVESPPPPPLPPSPIPPIIVQFASARSFRTHYDLFLRCGEVYVTHVETPAPGTPLDILIEIPDGDVALVVRAVLLRSVRPPEVPKPGWVARISDPDGAVAERLATAAYTLRD